MASLSALPTLGQRAANGRSEPKVTDAPVATRGSYAQIAEFKKSLSPWGVQGNRFWS